MKIERVSYQKTFSIGPYLTDKVGIESGVDAGETPELVLTTLKAIAEEWHKVSNISLYGDSGITGQGCKIPSVGKPMHVDSELDNLRKLLNDIDSQEDALALVKKAGFQYHIELNEIAKSKPHKK